MSRRLPIPADLAPFSARPGVGNWLRAFWLPVTAFRLILRTRRLRRLMAGCAVLTLASFIAVLTGLTFGVGPLLGWLWPRPPGLPALALWYLLEALGFVLFAVLLLNTVPVLVLSPLQNALSAETEAALSSGPSVGAQTVPAGPVFSLAAFLPTLLRVLILWMGNAALLVLAAVSGPLGVLVAGFGLAWTALWMGAEYLEIPLSRHGHGSRRVFAVVRTHLGVCLAFGSAVFLLMWVPVVNLFFVPVAVVAGTLLFRGLNAFPPLAPGRYGLAPPTDERPR